MIFKRLKEIKKGLLVTKQGGLFLCVVCLMWSQSATANSLNVDNKTKELCNTIVHNIYLELLSVKDQNVELSDFDDKALKKTDDDIYEINYEQSPGYSFKIHFVSLNDETGLQEEAGYSYWSYPVFNIKLSILLNRDKANHLLDLNKLISHQAQLLYDHQQKYLPLQLILKTTQPLYKINEDVEFEVTLKNIGAQVLKVSSLGEQSLFCWIDDKIWGTDKVNAEKSKDVVLAPAQSIAQKFKIAGTSVAHEMVVYCSYGLKYKGVQPYDLLKIQIEP